MPFKANDFKPGALEQRAFCRVNRIFPASGTDTVEVVGDKDFTESCVGHSVLIRSVLVSPVSNVAAQKLPERSKPLSTASLMRLLI